MANLESDASGFLDFASSAAAVRVTQAMQSSRTIDKKPSPRPLFWRTHCQARNSLSSLDTARWRGMFPIFARSTRLFFAFTPSEEVRRQLTLCGGTHPIRIDFTEDPNATIDVAEEFLRRNRYTEAGDNLVIISDVCARDALVDCVQLRQAKGRDR